MNTQKVGKFIYEERKKMNLPQKQLADILNITDKAIFRWETGKGYPNIEMLVKLSETYYGFTIVPNKIGDELYSSNCNVYIRIKID